MPHSTPEKRAEYDRRRDKRAKAVRDRRWRTARTRTGGCPNCGRFKFEELDGDMALCSDCAEYRRVWMKRNR